MNVLRCRLGQSHSCKRRNVFSSYLIFLLFQGTTFLVLFLLLLFLSSTSQYLWTCTKETLRQVHKKFGFVKTIGSMNKPVQEWTSWGGLYQLSAEGKEDVVTTWSFLCSRNSATTCCPSPWADGDLDGNLAVNPSCSACSCCNWKVFSMCVCWADSQMCGKKDWVEIRFNLKT